MGDWDLRNVISIFYGGGVADLAPWPMIQVGHFRELNCYNIIPFKKQGVKAGGCVWEN
jgi:hypothetical protein